MEPITTGALISAGSSLLGGLFGSKSKKKAAARAYAQHRARFVTLREDSEKAGFNPLTALGSGSIDAPILDDGAGMMGQSIAEAGMRIGNAISDNEALKIEKGKLEMERAKLAAAVRTQTINPRVAGIYSGPTAQPLNPSRGVRPAINPNPGPGAAPWSPYQKPLTVDKTPTMIMGDDGLPTANPDNDMEFEKDAYVAARDGSIFKIGKEVLRRNLPAYHPLSPDGPAWRAYDWTEDKVRKTPAFLSDFAKDQKKGSKNRKATRESEFLNRPASRDLMLNPYLKGNY